MASRARPKTAPIPVAVSRERIGEVFADSPLPEPTDAVGFLLWQALLAYQRRVERILEGTGITHLQFAVLATAGRLALFKPEVSQRDIVSHSGIKEAQVSLMIKALRSKALLFQQLGEHDPRVRAIRLTERGARSLENALPLVADVQRDLWPSAELHGEMSTVLLEALRRWGVVEHR